MTGGYGVFRRGLRGGRLRLRLGAAGLGAVEDLTPVLRGGHWAGKACNRALRGWTGCRRPSAGVRMTGSCAKNSGSNRHSGRSWPLRLAGIETADVNERAVAAGTGAPHRLCRVPACWRRPAAVPPWPCFALLAARYRTALLERGLAALSRFALLERNSGRAGLRPAVRQATAQPGPYGIWDSCTQPIRERASASDSTMGKCWRLGGRTLFLKTAASRDPAYGQTESGCLRGRGHRCHAPRPAHRVSARDRALK